MALRASQEWFLTAPWEPVYVRRGDALGLRGLNDLLGDAVAPGLTARTRDARWVTILAWCLVRSHEVWSADGSRDVIRTREQAAQRYAWLRPLELMWVARALKMLPDEPPGRQLAGQRRVRVWLREGCSAPCFAMTPDQYRGYRQTGMYGAYRTLLRSLPGVTRQRDGWTPDRSCHALAQEADGLLGKARRVLEPNGDRRRRSDWEGKEDQWWLRHWRAFDQGSKLALPHRRDAVVVLEEAKALRSLIFQGSPDGELRARVASVLASARVKDHQALCEYLVHALRAERHSATIAMLPRFARLADSGVAAMDSIARELARNREGPELSIPELARRAPVREACAQLTDAARSWLGSERADVRHLESAERFARSADVKGSEQQLRRLLHHHLCHGGGVRWFALRGDAVLPNLRLSERPSSRYRFRLASLARMAVQAGETRTMPSALIADEDGDDEEE